MRLVLKIDKLTWNFVKKKDKKLNGMDGWMEDGMC